MSTEQREGVQRRCLVNRGRGLNTDSNACVNCIAPCACYIRLLNKISRSFDVGIYLDNPILQN